MITRDNPDDLSWLAFRYVTDELEEVTRFAFETRLLDDPEACAAVAQAVELLGVCLQIESANAVARSRPVRPFRRRSVFALTTVIAAASILLASVFNPWSRPMADPGDAPGQTIALELAWASLQREASLPFPEPGPDDWRVDLLGEDEVSMLEPEGDQDPNPPDWLLIAVDRAGDPGDSQSWPSEN